jgi:hypothetical protein
MKSITRGDFPSGQIKQVEERVLGAYSRSGEKGLINPNTKPGPPSKEYLGDAEDQNARQLKAVAIMIQAV